MGRVRTLPEMVINHIAAGEVVERPVSVVKELIENALDAQAHTIRVSIQGGGIDLVQVDDDGIGMDAEDAALCCTRHATSKIATIEDLARLTTMGFRGEALSSIASVSRLQLVTRCHSEVQGTRVIIEGGELTSLEACGAAPGTSLRIADLFYNTPARLKFLKRPATEASHISHCFTSLALTAREVHMTLSLNGRLHTQVPPTPTLRERLEAVFGDEFSQHLLAVEGEEGALRIQGYVGQGTLHRATRRQQFFFVNGRPVTSRMLSYALYEAYRTLLPRDRHPVACLWVTLPTEDVDVNVHPAKLEVRFRQETHVHDCLRRLLRQQLQSSVASPSIAVPKEQFPATSAPGVVSRPSPMLWQARPVDSQPASSSKEPRPAIEETPTELRWHTGYPEAGRAILDGIPLGQLHDTYILMQYSDGMFLVDQHAAHERVLYERLCAQIREGCQLAQHLLFPTLLDLGATDAQWVASCLPHLQMLGFTLEPFGGHAYRLLSVPALLSARDHTAALMDILEVLRDPDPTTPVTDSMTRVLHRTVTVMACHSAIRAHQHLQTEVMRALLHDLAHTAMPFTCPHGRPVLLHVDLASIEKRFLRC